MGRFVDETGLDWMGGAVLLGYVLCSMYVS